MLQNLSIHNFAIANHVELQLEKGLTVITGETGAGKSIVLDALCMASGDRADSGSVKYGAEKAEISACFDIHHLPDVQQWLEAEDLEDDENLCVIRRVITKEGRSRGYINGRPSPISKLRQLGQKLVEIHSQHAHQSLMQPQTHIHMLDNYGQLQAALTECHTDFKTWKALAKQLKDLENQQDELNDKKQLLGYQLEELEALNLQENELEKIEQEHHRLSQAEALKQQSYQVHELSSGESGPASTSARDLLRQISHLTEQINDHTPHLDTAKDLFQQAMINVDEASNEILAYHQSLSLDPEHLHQLNQRLSDIHELARKHRIPAESIPTVHQQVAEEFALLNDSDHSLEALQQKEAEAKEKFLAISQSLHQQRTETAKSLDTVIMQQLTRLGMKHCKFQTRITTLDLNKASKLGTDHVEFEVSSNPGQPFQSLTKVASGGELSRISLAIQVANASRSQIPTLVFDEVDVGIGGATAEIVGELLKAIGKSGQVISVTHQSQVAAQGDHHLKACKTSSEHDTDTQMVPLNKSARIKEVARMMGGQQLTETTLQLAEEMIREP